MCIMAMYTIIQTSIDDFNVNMDSLAQKGNWTVAVHAKGLGGVSIPSTQGDGGGGKLRSVKLFPNSNEHHTGGCTFVNSASRDDGIMNSDWHLESNR